MGEIVRRIQAGIEVERNFEALYTHFHPRMIVYLAKRGVERGLCEDLTQEAFLRVSKNIGSFEHQSRFARWVFQILENLLLNEVRRVKAAKRDGVEVPIEEEVKARADGKKDVASLLVAVGPSADEELERREQAAALRRAVSTLPPQMQRCVALRLDQDRKYREIAEVMKISIDTVKAQIGHAKLRLRKVLTEGHRALERLESEVLE